MLQSSACVEIVLRSMKIHPMEGRTETTPRLRWWPRSLASGLLWVAPLAAALFILLHESLVGGKGLVAADGVLCFPPWNRPEQPSNGLLNDQFRTFLPTREFVHQRLMQRDFPLWDPHLCCGVPNVGSIQSALFFPVNLLLSPLDPFKRSL